MSGGKTRFGVTQAPWRSSRRHRKGPWKRTPRRRRSSDLRVEPLEVRAMLANAAPSGADVTISLLEDGTRTFTTSDFVFSDRNDTPANAFLAVKIATLPGAGSLRLNGTNVTAGQVVAVADITANKLVYTPAANASGTGYASFTFQVQDDGGTLNGGVDLDQSPNTITVNVTSVNDAPAGTDKTVTMLEDDNYTFATSDFVFSDPNDTPANAFLAVKIATLPGAGSLRLNGTNVTAGQVVAVADITANKLVYTPAANANGTGYASFTFQVQDDGGTLNGGVDLDQSPNTITVNVTNVNDAPVGTDKTVTILEDGTHTFSVSDFFSDPHDSPPNTLLSVTIVSIPLAGSLTLSNVSLTADQSIPALALGNLKYKPAPNVSGSSYAWFTFRVKDNGGTADGGIDTDPTVRTITIDVTPVDDPPTRTAGSPTPITVDQDSKNATAVSLGLAGLAYSPGGGDDEVSQPLTYTVTQVPAFITLFKANGTTEVAENTVVTLEELRGLTYKRVPLASGSGTVKWSVVDTGSNSAPNSNILSESLAITVQADTTPPSPPQRPSLDINTDSGVKGDNNTTFVRPTLTVVGPSDAASLSISLTNSSATPSPVTLTATRDAGTDTWRATPASDLAVGVWTVTARAKDAALNESASSTALSLKIESVPATPSEPDLDASSDSGASDTDDITNKTRPTFKGTAVAGLTVELFATKSGATAVSLGSVLAGNDGAWQLTPIDSKKLSDGVYDITATATDASGNTSVASAPLAVTIDTTPPDAPTAPVLLALDDSGKAGDGLTNVTTPRFTGTAAANIPVVLVATSPLGETSPKGTAIADANGKWKIPSAMLTDGLWTIQARATDAAGNQSKLSAETKLTISTAVPGTPMVSLASLDDTGFSNTDGITKSTTPTFVGSAAAGTTVNVFRRNITANGPVEPLGTLLAEAKNAGQWFLPFDTKITTPFTDAVYEITATATDESGNVSPSAPLDIVIDTTAPSLQLLVKSVAAANEPVRSAAATFGEEVRGLVAADFDLAVTANGVRRPLTLAGTATVTPDAPGANADKSWTIGSLAKITGSSGTYTLALNKARLDAGLTAAQDLAGNLLTFSSTKQEWTTDTTAPTVRSMTATPTPTPPNTAWPWNTSVASVDVVFDESVNGVDVADFKLTRDGTAVTLPNTVTLTGTGATRRLNGLGSSTGTDGTYVLTLVAKDSGIKDTAGSGNLLFANESTLWRIDTTRPTATFSTIASPRSTAVDSITLTFAEPVTGVALTDFTLKRGGTIVPLSASTLLTPASGSAATFALTGLAGLTAASGNYTLEFNKDAGTKVTDAAGNQMAANPTSLAWTVDTKAPMATIAHTPAGTLRNTAVTQASVMFDMNVTGVTANDFRLTRNGSVVSLAGATVASTSDSAYTLTLPNTATSADGVYVLTLVASGSGIAGKAAPNNPLQTDALSNKWTMDGTKPSVSLAVIGKTATAFTVRALFSESVKGFSATDTNDVTITGGTIGNARNGTLVGREYLFDVTPNTPAAGNPTGPAAVTLKAAAAKDDAGNDSTASNELRLISDFTPPLAKLAAPPITQNSPFTVDAFFSEPVTGFTPAGITVTNGTVTTNSLAGQGTAWKFTVTPTAAGVVTVSLKAKAAVDGSDNASLASSTVNVVYDNARPAVTLANLGGSPSRAAVLSIAATFSEDVTGITANDLSVVGNAKVIGFTGNGKNYTFQVQPNADGEIALKVAENVAIDAIGWGNTASQELKVVSDRTPPRLAAMTGPAADGKVIIRLSEEVTGFDPGDFVLTRNGSPVSLAGATLTGPTGTNKTEWTLSLGTSIAEAGPYRLELTASTSGVVDLAKNPLVDDRSSPATTLVTTFDTTPPQAKFGIVPFFRPGALSSVSLNFTENVTGLDLADLTLSRDSTPVNSLDKLSGITLTPNAGPAASYTIGGLAAHQQKDGVYAITLSTDTSGITDASGYKLIKTGFAPNQQDAAVSWTLDSKLPTATLGPVVPVATAAITKLPVTFSEAVSGADPSDFTLTRNGTVVPLAGAALVATDKTRASFELTNLAALTTALGEYSLTLRDAGTGIVDVAGNPLGAPVVAKWSRVAPAQGPLTGAFAAVSPNPRTTSLPSLAINFTRFVTGVGPEDFFLSRTVNGVTSALPTTGLTVTGTAASRTVGGLENLTRGSGQYELRLKAAGSDIVDASNNTIKLQSDIVASWSTVASAATIVLDDPVSPGAARDGATITFTKPITGMKLAALSLLRGGVPVSLTGTSLTAVSQAVYRITGLAPLVASANSYELRLVSAGTGIVGVADRLPVQESAVVSWTQAATTVRAAFLAVAPLTPSPIAAVRLRFNAAVRGVDLNDFELTVDRADGRGQQVVPLRGVIISGSGTSWTVSNLAALQDGAGMYTLRLKNLNGDIRTGAGAALAEDAIIRWKI